MKDLLLLLLALPMASMSCSLSPDTGWDSGNPFAKVRLMFDS